MADDVNKNVPAPLANALKSRLTREGTEPVKTAIVEITTSAQVDAKIAETLAKKAGIQAKFAAKKRLYVVGGPMNRLRSEFRMRGYHSDADGISFFAGEDVVAVNQYVAGENVKWAAYGIIAVEMLDNMEKHFGPRTPLHEAMEWFGERM